MVNEVAGKVRIWSRGKFWVLRGTVIGLALGFAFISSALVMTGAWDEAAPDRAAAELVATATSEPTSRPISTATATDTPEPTLTTTATPVPTATNTPVPASAPQSQPQAPAQQGSQPVAQPTSPPPAPTSPPPPPPPSCPTAPLVGYAADLFNAANRERETRGVPRLSLNGCAVYVAQVRSDDMANLGYFSHTSPSGQTAFSLLDAHRVPHGWAGENLARNNYPDHESVGVAIRDLMASDGHRANILNRNYTSLGVAVAFDGQGMKYFTMVFLGPP